MKREPGFPQEQLEGDPGSSESLELAKRSASEKLEALLGRNKIRDFSVRFMNIAEFRSLMEGGGIGGDEVSVLNRREEAKPVTLSKTVYEKALERHKSEADPVSVALQSVREYLISMSRYEIDRKRKVGGSREEQEEITISPREYNDLFTFDFEEFLKSAQLSGWANTISQMTNWDVSCRAVNFYEAFIQRILPRLRKKAQLKMANNENASEADLRSTVLALIREHLLEQIETFRLNTRGEEFEKKTIESIGQKALALESKAVDSTMSIEEVKRAKAEAGALKFMAELFADATATVAEFENNPEFLSQPGNLPKLLWAISNMGDINEHHEDSIKQQQYQLAVVYNSTFGGSSFGRGWAIGGGRDNTLAAVAILPSSILSKQIEEISQGSGKHAVPVFDSRGGLKFPSK